MNYIKRLKEARKRLGMTQSSLASRIGIPLSTYAGYESGNSEPPLSRLVAIMEILEIDANYLFQDSLENVRETTVTNKEYILLEKYRTLEEASKDAVDAVLDACFKRDNK